MFVVSGMTASVSDRASVRGLVIGGLVLISAGLSLWLVPGATSHWCAIVPRLMSRVIGVGALNPARSSMVLEYAPDGRSGLATGIMDTSWQVGVAVGVAALGALIPVTPEGPNDFVAGLHQAMIAAAVIALAGAVACAFLFRASTIDDPQLALDPVLTLNHYKALRRRDERIVRLGCTPPQRHHSRRTAVQLSKGPFADAPARLGGWLLDRCAITTWATHALWVLLANGAMTSGWSWAATAEEPPCLRAPRPLWWRRVAQQVVPEVEGYLAEAARSR